MSRTHEMELSCEPTIRSRGVCEPALEPRGEWEGSQTRGQDFKPDLGNSAVRHYRGAFENVAMVEMRTQLAIERAGLVTLHLQLAGMSTLLCKRPGLVFGDGCAREGGNFPFPRSAIFEKVCGFMTPPAPGPASVPATES